MTAPTAATLASRGGGSTVKRLAGWVEGIHRRVGLRTKIMGIAVLSVLVLAVGMAYQTFSTMSHALLAVLDYRAISTANDLAARSADLVLTGNRYALYELLSDTVKNTRDLRYVFILDPHGNVVVHTFGQGFPLDLLAANQLKPGQAYSLTILDSDEGYIHDVAVPIFDGRAGQVRVGFTEKLVDQTLARTAAGHVLMLGLVSLLAVVAAYGLTHLLTRPVRELVAAATAVSQGDLTRKVSIDTNDELGRLGQAFNEMTDSLERSRTEIQHLSTMRGQLVSKVIAAQEEERKRIARELHDETGQCLTSLMLFMRALEDVSDVDQVRDGLRQLRAMTAEALDKVKRISAELRPSVLDDLGLTAAIERYVSDFSAQTGLQVCLEVQGMEGVRLSREAEVAVYRIVQEGLTNVARHAQASLVILDIKRSLNDVVLTLSDNGRGFDLEALMSSDDTARRMGLFGMQERASLVGGRFSVDSRVGRGTRIRLEIPLVPRQNGHSGDVQKEGTPGRR